MSKNASDKSTLSHYVLAAVIGLTALVPLPKTANATGFPVVDILNVAQSTITAYESVMTTAQTYISMAQDLKQTMRSITAFDVGAVFLDNEQKTALLEFINTGKSVYGALRKTQDVYEDMQRLFASSPYKNFDDFLKNISIRKDQGDRMAKSLYESAKLAEDELERAHEQHMKVVNEMPMIEGVTDAAIATAQSVGVLIQQNQGVIQMMSASNRIQGQELQREYAERAAREEALKEYYENATSQTAKDRAMLSK